MEKSEWQQQLLPQRKAQSEFATYKVVSKGDTLAIFPFFLPFWQQQESKPSSLCLIFSLLLPFLQKQQGTASHSWAEKCRHFCTADQSLRWLTLPWVSNHRQHLFIMGGLVGAELLVVTVRTCKKKSLKKLQKFSLDIPSQLRLCIWMILEYMPFNLFLL